MAKFNTNPPYVNLELVVTPASFNRHTGQTSPGKRIKFVNGVYSTTDKEELKVLRDPKRGYGVYIFEEKIPQENQKGGN
ncbi:MAG: hypothetical protein WBJ85_08200 [Acetomicrobium sp.]|jgi:hypothetical protein